MNAAKPLEFFRVNQIQNYLVLDINVIMDGITKNFFHRQALIFKGHDATFLIFIK